GGRSKLRWRYGYRGREASCGAGTPARPTGDKRDPHQRGVGVTRQSNAGGTREPLIPFRSLVALPPRRTWCSSPKICCSLPLRQSTLPLLATPTKGHPCLRDDYG